MLVGGQDEALLDRGNPPGTAVTIDVRGRQLEAEVTRPPFVQTDVSG